MHGPFAIAIPYSRPAQSRLAELSEALKRRVFHLPSAPAELFFEGEARNDRTVDVVSVGSLVAVKNLELPLECAARRPDLSFAIVGDGPDAGPLRRRANRLRLQNVRFLGAMAPREVLSILHSARLFINTSLTEGSPTAALEAMACGLPVVLTPSNSYAHIADDGVSGRVTKGWDAGELASAIDEFLGNPERLRTASAAARQIADQHRWSSKAQLVTNLMWEAVSRKQGQR